MSITAEKIAAVFDDWSKPSKLQLHAGEMTAGELRTVRAILPAVKAAVVSLLQQGEPEYVKLERLGRTTEGNGLPEALRHIERLLEAPETEGKDQHGVHFKERRQYARAFVDAMLSASPLPPAPGAETGENESSIAPAREVNLKPGWLARDIESASRRIDEWEGRSSSRQAVLEEAAKLIEPERSAPCDCVEQYETELGPRWRPTCDCRNEGDLLRIYSWCEGKNDAARIRALATTPPAEGETK